MFCRNELVAPHPCCLRAIRILWERPTVGHLGNVILRINGRKCTLALGGGARDGHFSCDYLLGDSGSNGCLGGICVTKAATKRKSSEVYCRLRGSVFLRWRGQHYT